VFSSDMGYACTGARWRRWWRISTVLVKKNAPALPEYRLRSGASFLESGGPVQVVYETLRAEAVGEIAGQSITASWRHGWERFGLLGLFNQDPELRTSIPETMRQVYLQGASESPVGWRKTMDVYRAVIDKSFEDILSRRASDELIASPCGNLRESVYASSTETVDDPEPSCAVALSG